MRIIAESRLKQMAQEHGDCMEHEFPLVPIRDNTHLEQALEIIDRLTDQPQRSAGAEEYLGALADLVYVYEQEHVTWPPVTGVDVLRHLMEDHRLTQADLAP